jgi:demethylmenaquinone methyltransferase/2-methoxy-6-polyprenyl-1,4-benzoquinol methylase
MSLPPEKQDARLMRGMFARIAPRYDFITRVFSYGMDAKWKRRAVREAGLEPGARVLDLACGTGDFARLVAERAPGAWIVAADLTPEMLRLARAAGAGEVLCADAMRLPFPNGAFDAVFVGYGLRNFPKPGEAVREIRRVLRTGGVLVSLDFFLPQRRVLRAIYLGYLFAQGAVWGMLLHGRARTYTYIPDSLRGFVSAAEFAKTLERAGYGAVRQRAFLFGGIAVHWAVREG